MSTRTKPTPQEEERFTYSWYLPVPGGKGSGALGPAGPAGGEMGLAAGAEEVEETGPEMGQLVQEVEVPEAKPSRGLGIFKNMSMSSLRLAGLSGWTVAAAAGMVAMMAFQSPLQLTRVLALVGVWAAISGAIWILPTKLMK